jgi:carbamoyltransferase
VQPAAGDAGGALGAALFVWHQLLGRPRAADGQDRMCGALLGPRFSTEDVRKALDQRGARYTHCEREDDLVGRVAAALADGNIVGWVQGRMEFGPRALGCRSILGDPRRPEMQSAMNRKTKFRESFRPFAPSVLREHAHEWFDTPPGADFPYMLFTAEVRAERRVPAPAAAPTGLGRLNAVRSTIPAVTHVDDTARVQTVDEPRHGRYYRLLRRFHALTGCPVLINTSFNVRGEPIVCTPDDAYRCFMATNIDVLVVEDFMLRKEDQPAVVRHEIDAYLARRELD